MAYSNKIIASRVGVLRAYELFCNVNLYILSQCSFEPLGPVVFGVLIEVLMGQVFSNLKAKATITILEAAEFRGKPSLRKKA